MKTATPILFCLALGGTACAAQTPPKLDPKQVINESNNFLKDREPEMTAEEYPVYERVSALMATQPDFAITLLEGMLVEKQTPSPAFEVMLGNAYYSVGDKGKAEAHYLSAVKRYPSFIRAWNDLGVLYYSLDRYADAVPCLSKALGLGSREPNTYGLLGYCLERSGSTVPAEMSYMQAISGDPENTDWIAGLLRVYVQGKQYGPAESLAAGLIRIRPSDSEYWLAYANILLFENKKMEAMVMLEACASAGVAGPGELGLLADLYAEQGLVTEAVGAYQKVLASTPALGEQRLLRYARALIASGRLDQAEGVLGGLPATLTPAGRLDCLRTRADYFAARKDWPGARRELGELLHASPLDGRALMSLGDAYVAEDDLTQAEFAYGEAFRVPETTYRASFELAGIELRHRHFEKCAEYLQKALSIERTDAVEDYLARVRSMIEK